MKIGKFNVVKGRDKTPPRIVLYGPGATGKSTLASTAPKAIWLCVDDGAREFDVTKVPFDDKGRVVPNNAAEVLRALTDVASGDLGDAKTFVLDGVTPLDIMLQEQVVQQNPKWKSIKTAGFGNGESETLLAWRPIIAKLDVINRERGLRIVLIGHRQLRKFKNSSGADFGIYDLAATTHTDGDVPGFLFGWADVYAHAEQEMLTQDVGRPGAMTTKGVAAEGDRLLHLAGTSAWTAKCRLSGAPPVVKLTNDDGTPKTWAEVFGAIEEKEPMKLREAIEGLLPALGESDGEAARKWLSTVGDDVPMLARGLERLRIKAEGVGSGVTKEEGEAA